MNPARMIVVAALAMMPLRASTWAQETSTIPGLFSPPDQTADLRAQIAEAEQKKAGDGVRALKIVKADEEHIRALRQMLRDALSDPDTLNRELSTKKSAEFTYRQNLN